MDTDALPHRCSRYIHFQRTPDARTCQNVQEEVSAQVGLTRCCIACHLTLHIDSAMWHWCGEYSHMWQIQPYRRPRTYSYDWSCDKEYKLFRLLYTKINKYSTCARWWAPTWSIGQVLSLIFQDLHKNLSVLAVPFMRVGYVSWGCKVCIRYESTFWCV